MSDESIKATGYSLAFRDRMFIKKHAARLGAELSDRVNDSASLRHIIRTFEREHPLPAEFVKDPECETVGQ